MKITKQTKIGAFALIVIVLFYAGINFIKGTDFLRRTNIYYANYEQVSGLKMGSSVVIKGLTVGTIQSMSFDANSSDNVVVEMSVSNKYKIPNDSKAKLFSDGLMGGKALELVLGNSSEYYHNGDTLLSCVGKDLMSSAGTELDAVMLIIKNLAGELSTTLSSVNTILDSNTTAVSTTMSNLAELSASVKDVVGEESESLKELISNMNNLSKALGDNAAKFDSIIGNVETFTDSLALSPVPAMIGNLSLALGELNTTLKVANDGEGTLGKLLNDQALYDSLEVSLGNLSVLLEDLKANPGRYVQFSVFGKKNK